MANEVYANGRELSCKAGSGKSICAFPDVCFTPPLTPATPPGVPIPYPNTGMTTDTSGGSKTVKISDKEVMLKDSSYFSTSTGDEAGCAPKKGVITSKIKGKVYFNSWSMDVKIEGENAVRHLDLTTHNHASKIGQTPPWAFLDSASMPEGECKTQSKKTEDCMEKHIKKNTHKSKREDFRKPGVSKVKAREGDDADVKWDELQKEEDFFNKEGTKESFCADPECKGTLECSLVPFNLFCCDDKTPHHVIPAHCFMPPGERKDGKGTRYPGCENYDDEAAPCICLHGETKSDKGPTGLKEHGRVHEIVDAKEDSFMKRTPAMTPGGKRQMSGGQPVDNVEARTWNFEQANDAGADAVAQVKPECNKECLKMQSEAAHKRMGLDVGPGKSDKLNLRADSSGNRTPDGFVPGGAAAPAAPAT